MVIFGFWSKKQDGDLGILWRVASLKRWTFIERIVRSMEFNLEKLGGWAIDIAEHSLLKFARATFGLPAGRESLLLKIYACRGIALGQIALRISGPERASS